MLTQLALACGLVVACAILNRVRGGGFGGQYLPGRALLWVSVAIGVVAWTIHPWPVAVAFGLGYLAWGVLAWSYILCRLAGIEPPRSPGLGEGFCLIAPGTVAPVFVRMMFVLPGVVAVAWLMGHWWFLAAAPAFAAAATAAYTLLFRPIGTHDWMRAEIATGLCWGLLILSAAI